MTLLFMMEKGIGFMPHWGEQFKEWRKQAGLSLRAAAEKSGLSPTYIDNLEKNKPHPVTGALPEPPRKTILALAQAYNVPEEIALNAAGFTPLPAAIRVDTSEIVERDAEGHLSKRTGTKEEIQEAVRELFPELLDLLRQEKPAKIPGENLQENK